MCVNVAPRPQVYFLNMTVHNSDSDSPKAKITLSYKNATECNDHGYANLYDES